jgi:hypothetical protein
MNTMFGRGMAAPAREANIDAAVARPAIERKERLSIRVMDV